MSTLLPGHRADRLRLQIHRCVDVLHFRDLIDVTHVEVGQHSLLRPVTDVRATASDGHEIARLIQIVASVEWKLELFAVLPLEEFEDSLLKSLVDVLKWERLLKGLIQSLRAPGDLLVVLIGLLLDVAHEVLRFVNELDSLLGWRV